MSFESGVDGIGSLPTEDETTHLWGQFVDQTSSRTQAAPDKLTPATPPFAGKEYDGTKFNKQKNEYECRNILDFS